MTTDFLLGFASGLAYVAVVALLVFLWWLERQEQEKPPLTRAEREFLSTVKKAVRR